MTWAPLLLADRSPCLRMLVLRDLLDRPSDDEEIRELAELRETDPLVRDLLELQADDGSWQAVPPAQPGRGSVVRGTALALTRFGYLGFGPEYPAVRRGAEYLLSLQQEDGSWPIPGTHPELKEHEGYSMVPLQTAIPLRGLAACGYGTHAAAERAYDWLLARRLTDGAWPSGIASGTYGYVAGYRRLAHSRWGCRSNTTGALHCLALHPTSRSTPAARRALDLLLGRETKEQHTLGLEMARLIGVEPARGFFTYYARFDIAFVLDLCWRVGASLEDARIAEAADFVRGLQGPYGLWRYAAHPQASRWVTFDLLRSLSRLDSSTDWLSEEPRTPFRAYPKRPKRF